MNHAQKVNALNKCISQFTITVERQHLIDYVRKTVGINLVQDNMFSKLRKVGVIQVVKKGNRSQNGLYKFSGEKVKIQYFGYSPMKVSQESSNITNKTVINEEYCINYLKKRGFIILKRF